jgi:hypothetical protein
MNNESMNNQSEPLNEEMLGGTENDEKKEKEEHDKITRQAKEQFENMVENYLASNPFSSSNGSNSVSEFEIRFGSNPKLAKPISKIDYDNVVKQLYSCGFKPQIEDGIHLLRINSEYLDNRSGITKMSNIRAEITGLDMIQEYCRTNSLQKLIDMPSTVFNKLKFTKKSPAKTSTSEIIKPLDMRDFNFRVSHQIEQDFNIHTNIARNIISKWSDSKKLFRCMNRVRFYHPDYPIFADLSIVKTSKKTNRITIPQYTIQEAGVFNNIEHYEIELEIDNTKVGNGSIFKDKNKLLEVLRKVIRIVLTGLQGSKFPISYYDRDQILHQYMKVIHGSEYLKRRVKPRDFIGPSSFTLQLENILPENETSTVPNIRKGYTVTDKADGDRKLLFISNIGKIYLIDTNMNVIFMGCKTNEKTMFNSIIDGEHIKYDKHGKFINLYACFDVYYINKKSVREFKFITNNIEEDVNKFRLPLLDRMVELMKPKSILDLSESNESIKSSEFTIKCKQFYMGTDIVSIFEGCSRILSNNKEGLFEYNTDGLIFTPIDKAVSSNKVGTAGPLKKIAWEYSFKWKPVEFNTIDFLVSIKKDKNGKDEVHHIFQDGRNLQGIQEVIQYKTLVLRCGYDELKHGFLNPFQNIIDDKIINPDDIDNEDTYKPVPFRPTSPYDENACYTNIILKEDGNKLYLMTEEQEYFEEDMIVEFKYVMTNKDGWKWVPLRVRYDKTSLLRSGEPEYGNAYHVANSNWNSIHHPITEKMITTGEDIPLNIISEDVYYNRSNEETSTQGLRDFHNLYVKKNLIVGVSRRGDSLIDLAVGKAGDLSKWIRANLSFVFGIDYSKDNIHNNIDGACARYLKARRKNKDIPDAIFIPGNSSLNIRSGKALTTEKDIQIMNAIFGNGPKDATILGKGVHKHYGIAQNGFQITSCQFALHYFFENKTTFHNFLRNVVECTRIQGYFIGTCYDGKQVFNLLKPKKNGESETIMANDRKIFEITKLYDETGFPDDDMSLGYGINVYQESINKVFREYLVNFDYFIRIMSDYGFVLLTKTEAQKMNLPDGSGLFSELFKFMENEIKRDPQIKNDYGTAINMNSDEKRISFLNRYFIFKKVRSVNTDKIHKILANEYAVAEKIDDELMADMEKEIEKNKEEEKPIFIKEKKKVIIKKNIDISVKPVDNPIVAEGPIIGKKRIIIKKP